MIISREKQTERQNIFQNNNGVILNTNPHFDLTKTINKT